RPPATCHPRRSCRTQTPDEPRRVRRPIPPQRHRSVPITNEDRLVLAIGGGAAVPLGPELGVVGDRGVVIGRAGPPADGCPGIAAAPRVALHGPASGTVSPMPSACSAKGYGGRAGGPATFNALVREPTALRDAVT